MTDIEVIIGSNKYEGWKEISVTRNMDDLVGEFELQAAEKADFESNNWPLRMGDICIIKVGGTAIMTGYLEDIDISYGQGEHTVRVAGRDIITDLVDCGRPEQDGPKYWDQATVLGVIEALVAPFDNIDVAVDSAAAALANTRLEWFAFNEGEALFEALTRAATMAPLRLLSLGDGKLTLGIAGTGRTGDGLEYGVNILSGGLKSSDRDRFSDYFSLGQGYGTDEKQVADFAHPKGEAQDPVITRYRPFVMLGDDVSTFGNTESGAKWEAAVRAGNSRTYSYAVQGWVQRDGLPWKLNQVVPVKDKVFNLDDNLLICGLAFSFNEQGTITQLQLCSPEKYKAEAELNKISTGFDDF